MGWNDKLAYSTLKVVKVRDWRLGLLHYLFMVFLSTKKKTLNVSAHFLVKS